MTTKDEALKLALEALELNNDEWKSLADFGDSGYWKAEDRDHYQQTNKAIAALREALNAPLAEQPARCEPAEDGVCEALDCPNHTAQRPARSADTWVHATEWRGLTDEDVLDLCKTFMGQIDKISFIRATENKIKERNT